MTDKYFVYPDAGDSVWCPLNPEPATLKQCLDIIRKRMELINAQGYWRDDGGHEVAPSQVRFVIENENFISNHL